MEACIIFKGSRRTCINCQSNFCTSPPNHKDEFSSLDFGLSEFGGKDEKDRFKRCRRFVYEKGSLIRAAGDITI